MKSKIFSFKKLELFKELDAFREGKFFAVIDQKVKNHLPQWIQFSPYVYWLKSPELDKNLETYGVALDFFLKQGITAQTHLFAFGGGATLDFTGFISATLLGGIEWSAIPTTLAGMVDGAFSDLVSLNLPQGKNFVGSQYTPYAVYLCHDFLTTLTDAEWLCGKAEILKCGLLSRDIHDLVLKTHALEDLTMEVARFKNDVHGDQLYTDFGHNVARAMELTLRLPSGQASLLGVRLLHRVFKLDEPLTQLSKMQAPLTVGLTKFDVEAYSHFDLKVFLGHLEHDRSTHHGKHTFILAKRSGTLFTEEISHKDFAARLLGLLEVRRAA